MARLLFAKLASLAAVVSSAVLLSGCETSSGRPELCKPGVTDPRCPKVQKVKPIKVEEKVVKANAPKGGRNY